MIVELDVGLSYGCRRHGVPARSSFTRWAQAALAAAGAQGAFQLSIRVVDVDEGLALNRDFRGRLYATNVLSFPADAVVPGGPRLLGDLALCAPVIAREAHEQGKLATAHYAHLTIHGVLHLLGYDHEVDAAAVAMEALELKALAALGLANPYESAQG
jgi:probable rRNA maturation factor